MFTRTTQAPTSSRTEILARERILVDDKQRTAERSPRPGKDPLQATGGLFGVRWGYCSVPVVGKI